MSPDALHSDAAEPRRAAAARRALPISLLLAVVAVLLAVVLAVLCSASVGRAAAAGAVTGPQTSLHYAPGENLGTGRRAGQYLPGADGFNLADVSTPEQLQSLPAGVSGLVYLGLCEGANADFQATVSPFIGKPGLFGFYLMDEPDPTGRYGPLCPAADLKQEADWIEANAPGARTFIVLLNLGTSSEPDYMDTYDAADTDIELFGLDPYPCRREFKGCDYAVIGAAVSAAQAAGIAEDQIVPVYQAFGGGGYSSWTLPTAAQEEAILSTWAPLVPAPAFDYAYAWGRQDRDRSLAHSRSLRAVFARHNS